VDSWPQGFARQLDSAGHGLLAVGHGLLSRAERIRQAEDLFAPGTLSDDDAADLQRLALWLDDTRAQLRRALREWEGFEPPPVERAD
jgi:hypothetical protein